MSQSKTYLKFKETRSQEDLETLHSYLKRLSEISDILNGDEDLDNETENKLYDEDEDLTDKTVRLIFGDVFFVFAGEYNLDGYDSWEYAIEYLIIMFFAKWNKQSERYHDVSFEEEAHNNDHDLEYIRTRKHYSWVKYVKLRSYKK